VAIDITEPDYYVIARDTDIGRRYLGFRKRGSGFDECGTWTGAAKFFSRAGAETVKSRRPDAETWNVWSHSELHTASMSLDPPPF
jgi:hypothetical protein